MLAALFPKKPYPLWLWGGHLALGGLGLIAAVAALHGTAGAAAFQRFLDTYVLNALTLGAMALAVTASAPRNRPPTEKEVDRRAG